jgi:hypothetical protein
MPREPASKQDSAPDRLSWLSECRTKPKVSRSGEPRGGSGGKRGKLRGRFSLTEMRGRGGGQWLLVKSDDEFADARRRPVISPPGSVESGMRVGELAGGKAT